MDTDLSMSMDSVRDHEREKDWRDLCAVATTEDDPIRLASLVSQILQVFEDRDRTSSPRIDEGRSQSALRPPSPSDAA